MATNEKKKKYDLEYARKKLKRIPLDVTKEKYEEIKAAADESGESVNGYIKTAIDDRIKNKWDREISGKIEGIVGAMTQQVREGSTNIIFVEPEGETDGFTSRMYHYVPNIKPEKQNEIIENKLTEIQKNTHCKK